MHKGENMVGILILDVKYFTCSVWLMSWGKVLFGLNSIYTTQNMFCTSCCFGAYVQSTTVNLDM